MLDIAISPLPGIDLAAAQHLTPHDFDIKTMERSAPGDDGVYIIELHKPVPDGMHVHVSIGLSPVPGLAGTVETLDFATAQPFLPTSIGCADQSLPLSANGTTYGKDSALACDQAGNQDQDSSQDQDNGQDQDDSQDNSSQDTSQNDQTAPNPAPIGQLPVTTAKQPAIGTPDQPPAPAGGQNNTPRTVAVQFSAAPAPFGPVVARNFVRITPPVDHLQTAINGNELDLNGDFKTATVYQIALNPAPLLDGNGRKLAMTGPSAAWVYWPAAQNALALVTGNGVIERYGPQMIPLTGQGYNQADVRIYAVDPLDRSFWPFPAQSFTTSDNDRPPAPGEEAAPYTEQSPIDVPGLQAQIARLGSPSISTLLQLPLNPQGPSASFGLDLTNEFARISGRNNPGTYLIGVRAVDQPGTRNWMRVQVTDLSTTIVEQERAVHFAVTSLSTGLPVAGAHVEVDTVIDNKWTALDEGNTAADGSYVWQADRHWPRNAPTRIVISKADDTLVIDPNQPPDRYTANGWTPGQNGWLGWTAAQDLSGRHPAAQTLCHLFTERPIYRPGDPVHIKTYIRQLYNGLLTPDGLTQHVQLTITGPDPSINWQYNLAPDSNGDADFLFDAPTTATGTYTAEIDINGSSCNSVTFIKDAYRLPRFKLRLDGPDSIPLDAPATVGLTAIYYAGGPVAGRPVRWRVTEFPYAFAPAARPGFIYATSTMFDQDYSNQSNAARESEAVTDKEGRASVIIDPTQEASNAPRSYVVEATVTGDDNLTVTETKQVLGLPSFVLGLQAPRFIPQGSAIPVQLLVEDASGKPVAGKPVTLTLLRRSWSSILQESDFSNGAAQYQTQVVDEKLIQRTVISGADVTKLNLPIDRAGVYIVQIQAADDLGWLQTVSEDLFIGGATPVSWPHPPATQFKVVTDKPDYVPGDTAKLILQSPFQTARALAIAELPDGTDSYQWLDVRNGYAVYTLPVQKSFMPRIPVHFVLLRGRLPGDATDGRFDLRRPETIAATAWIGVKPVKNIVTVAVTAPATALPGSTVDLTVKLTDDQGKPLSGEVTLWLLDQAVLALAPEAPLDPLPDFIRDRGSDLAFSDTRNWPFGLLPLDETPGGEGPVSAAAPSPNDLLNRVTVRKNFNPMPYYNPKLEIGPTGIATVKIKLPDDLTVFMIRAVAVSGPERFGYATGQIQVQLPVIVEPSLPRFVRPGDRFDLAGIGRIVAGPGGAGQAEVAVQGLTLAGPATRQFTWAPDVPQQFGFPVTVPSPGYTPQGALARTAVTVTMGVERLGDKATDAFSVQLPIELDRDPVHQRVLTDLTSAKPLSLPAIASPARPGTVKRVLLVSNEPALVRLYAGLDYLQNYPFGCTEQRIALARAEIAAQDFAGALDQGDQDRAKRDVNQTLAWITNATDGNGLVAFWPGNQGYVVLTAWAVEFMVEAQKAGYTVDPVEMATLTHALQQALRSDDPNLVSAYAYVERAWALAALAYAGELDRDYADELARQQDQLSLEGLAQVALALEVGGAGAAPIQKPLQDALWNGIVIKLRDGQSVYGGLQQGYLATVDDPEIFPSETRTLSEMLRATDPWSDPRRKILVAALVGLGAGDGWGSTNANAEALLALTDYLKNNSGAAAQTVTLTTPKGNEAIALSGKIPLARRVYADGGAVIVTAAAATAQSPISVQDDLTWLPVADGATVQPFTNGFVITREDNEILPNGAPPIRTLLDHAGMELAYHVGDIIEDHVQLVNPEDRNYVAITVPLAAGMEPLDPTLATAPPEATPSAPPTMTPSYVAYLDDKVSFYYDALPKGTYDFYFRTKAFTPGRFIQPAPQVVMMYHDSVSGGGAGAVVTITPAPPPK
jgi:uncharacterized protein YfaS (alpha-2-macroglobulin family)